ncbi:MAG: DNA mismatch repair endonuclease MutL [Peptostreptococcus sp.]|uniref:DNA mismatch repair endonuclease MutL n=1 Tax=Peptostreptococcus sp. TaxID=1262 RepID=UPI002FC7CDC6
MPKINVLDDITINKIAAGEVIERPSSIIKELVENSIDAGSKFISVEIENGGKDLIKIIDDGCGIDASDIDKAFMRHATSKINRAEDLYSLNSLGFRGEALASICAVSKLEMISKTKDSLTGTKIQLNGGIISSKEEIAANKGTQISVLSLFYNTPARRKFLRSNQSEALAITSLMNKLAIGNPDIRFKYTNNKKLVFETIGDGVLFNTIRKIYGKDISDNLIELDYESKYFNIQGYTANNNIYRSNRKLQHIFINGRYVKSANIMNVINDSYKAIIPINKFPVYFINMTMDPGTIDVNIHPSKLEIKFNKEDELLSELSDYIRGMLLKNSLIGKYRGSVNTKKDLFSYKDASRSFDSFSYSEEDQIENSKSKTSEKSLHEPVESSSIDNGVKSKGSNTIDNEASRVENSNVSSTNTRTHNDSDIKSKEISTENNIPDTYDTKKSFESNPSNSNKKAFLNEDVTKQIENLSEIKNINSFKKLKDYDTYDTYDTRKEEVFLKDTSEKSKKEKDENLDKEEKKENFNGYQNLSDNSKSKSIQESKKSYLNKNIQEENQMDFLDENDAAKNRDFKNLIFSGIIFDTYVIFTKADEMIMMDQHAAHERIRFEMYMKKFKNNTLSIQMLIEPIIMDLSPVDMALTVKNLDIFERFGFIIEEFGHKNISIRGVPNTFGSPESQRFIYEIIDNLGKITNVYDTKYDNIAEIACKSAIKGNEKISYQEAMELIKELELCENPYTCPHGRPIMVKMTKNDIEKMFKRKM